MYIGLKILIVYVKVMVNFSHIILCLCSTGAVAAARTAAWQHVIERTLWLQQTPGIPEPMRRQLLECPIVPVCHLWSTECRLLPRRQRSSGDTSPALRLDPGSSAPPRVPIAAIGPQQPVSRRRRHLLLLAPRLTSLARLTSKGPGQQAHALSHKRRRRL
jgi:hypothetical protein